MSTQQASRVGGQLTLERVKPFDTLLRSTVPVVLGCVRRSEGSVRRRRLDEGVAGR